MSWEKGIKDRSTFSKELSPQADFDIWIAVLLVLRFYSGDPMSSLGLAMIVKNAAATLRNCLHSVAGLPDQIVVADTGSSDGTPQLARELGAEVFDFPWQNDFAQARNAALKALKTDWVLVMDDDEELDPQAHHKILPLLGNPKVGAYSVTLRNYLPLRFSIGGHAPSVKPVAGTIPRAEQARAYADFPLYRLFRRHAEIYYVGRVHEMVAPSIRALGLDFASADFVIHHFGHLCSAQELRAKDELYQKLGRLKIEDFPNDAQSWTEMGQLEYERLQNYSAGIACFKRALALPGHSNVPYLSLASLYVDIQDDARALELLSRVAMKGRSAGAKEHIRGDALYNLGELKEARTAYCRALRVLPEDARIASKLGLTEVRMGLKRIGLARLLRASQANPEIFEMHDRLIKAYLLMNMMPQAAEAAERLAIEFPNPATISRAASIRAHMNQWKKAEETILRGLQQFPEDRNLLQAHTDIERETSRQRITPGTHRTPAGHLVS